ncbi:DUF805 domain-containing protein [Arthrobacter sp. GMC3]|uniref:DUF805 domain-containing protein n=1 Tax=Arthrobacter sp. GMC3 TaxID=2058894 RepID=UPI000CE2E233|nr:DUF805 domain-containing protein [Arthrobacter sp. GMC3]
MSLLATPSLDQPLYGATLTQAVTRFFRNYATFAGRASRSEFWWWALVAAIVNIVFGALIGLSINLANSGEETTTAVASIMLAAVYLVYPVFSLGILVPSLALFWRRLHDANKPGVYVLFALIPFGVGAIILLVFMLQPADPAGQRFDKQPAFIPGRVSF